MLNSYAPGGNYIIEHLNSYTLLDLIVLKTLLLMSLLFILLLLLFAVIRTGHLALSQSRSS